MASEVEICNRALQKLGAKRITSLTQDSVNARACNASYEAVRDKVLRCHIWNFAIKRAELPASSSAPAFGRANSYPLPSDFVKLAPQYPEWNQYYRDWQIEGRSILTNDRGPIQIRYIYQVSDPNEMDPIFRELLATELAFEMCEEITQSNTKKESLREDKSAIIAAARASNAFENVPTEAPDDDWSTYRR